MKREMLIVCACVAFAGCKNDSASSAAAASASATTTMASATSATTAAATTTAMATTATVAATAPAGFEPTKDEWFALQKKMMGAYDHFDTCAKLAADLEKWNVDNKDYLVKFRGWAAAYPDRAKSLKASAMDAHKAEMATWSQKVGPATKCQSDAKVVAVLKEINAD